MKAIVTALLLLICLQAAEGQISVVTPARGVSTYRPAKRARYAEKLQHSTTIFVLQNEDYDHLADFESAIKAGWTYTPYKIIRPSQLAEYEGKSGYSFYTFGAYFTGKYSTTQHLTYDLWYPMLNKKGKFRRQYFYSRLFLCLAPGKPIDMQKYDNSIQKYDTGLMQPVLADARFYNWSAGLLKGYLKTVTTLLSNNTPHNFAVGYRDSTLSALKTDTLYMVDFELAGEAAPAGQPGYADTTGNSGPLFATYPYPVRIISMGELTGLLNQSREIRYLTFVRDGSEKYITVYSSKRGMIYDTFREFSWNFKQKYMAQLARAIAQ